MSEWDDYFEQLVDAVDNLRAVHFKVERKARVLASTSNAVQDADSQVDSNMIERLTALKIENTRLIEENRHLNHQLEMMSAALDKQSSTNPPIEMQTPAVDDSLHFPDLSFSPQPSQVSKQPIEHSLPPVTPDVESDSHEIPEPDHLPMPIAPREELDSKRYEEPDMANSTIPDVLNDIPPKETPDSEPEPIIEPSETATIGRLELEEGQPMGGVIESPKTTPSVNPRPVVVEAELEEPIKKDDSNKFESSPRTQVQSATENESRERRPVTREPIDFEAQRKLKAAIRDVQRRIKIIENDEGPTSKSIIAEITEFYKSYHQQESLIKAPLQKIEDQIKSETAPIRHQFASQKQSLITQRDSELKPLKESLGSGETKEDIELDYANKKGALQSRLEKALSRLGEIESDSPRGIKGLFTSNAKKIKNIEQMDLLKEEIDEIETQLLHADGQYVDKLDKFQSAPKGADAEEIQAAIHARTQHYDELLNQIEADENREIERISGPYIGEKRDVEELAILKLDDLHMELEPQETSFVERFPRTKEIKPLAAELSDLERELQLI